LDSLVWLSHIINKPKSWIFAHPETALSGDDYLLLQNGWNRYQQGVPLPYLLGEWEFFGRKYEVNEHVLIPRPETELLIETAISRLANKGPQSILDVGTGTGCIAISLLLEFSDLQAVASDLSLQALKVARNNARRYQVLDRVRLINSDLLSGFRRKFDLICANLPYCSSDQLAMLDVAEHEPGIALDGGSDGFSIISRLLDQVDDFLAPGSLILLEIEAGHGKVARQAASAHFPHASIEVIRDYSGNERLLSIKFED
jgi:release factor glutamine methyltransferase